MRLHVLLVGASLVALATFANSRSAHAQGSEATGLGIGVQAMATTVVDIDEPGFAFPNLAGPSVVYQTPAWHVDGILHYASNGITSLGVGGRFWYEVHSTPASDLSVGGGLGLINIDVGDESDTSVHIEVGGKIRAFLTPSVALNGSVGVGYISGDFDLLTLGGHLIGTVGATYFFF